MSDYTMTTTVSQPYDAAVAAVRSALEEQGFGVLTEIDLSATLKGEPASRWRRRSFSAPAARRWPMRPSRPSRRSRPCCPATWWCAP